MGKRNVDNSTRARMTPSRRVLTLTIGVGALAVLAALLVPLLASASHPAPALPLTSPLTGTNETPDCTAADPLLSTLGLPSATGSGSGNRAHAGTRDSVAVWANATTYPDITAFDMSTSESIINGEAVSRSHMIIAGSNNQIRHNTEYGLANRPGAAFNLSGQDNCFSGLPAIAQVARATPAQPQGFPFQFDIDGDGDFLEHYAPTSQAAIDAMADPADGPQYFVCGISDPDLGGNAAAIAPGCTNGKMDVSVSGFQFPRGLYYVTGDAILAGQGLQATVTLVAGGNIKVSGSNQGVVQSKFSPYIQSLLFLSNFGTPNSKDVGEDAVKVEGSVSLFEGVVHAPKGRTTLAGSQLSFTCIVMGDRVRISGQLIYIDGDTCPTPGPGAPTIEVVKTADPLSRPEPGGDFTFTVTVTNNSTTSVTLTSLDDDIYGTLTGDSDCQVGTVLDANGDSCSFSFTESFTGNAGATQTDVVTVCAQGAGGSDCDDDPATVTITDVEPTLTVLKVASPLSLPEPGGMFTFTVTVTNTSAEAVTIESLDDDVHGPQTGDADCQVGTLLAANGGSCQFSFQGQFLGNAGDEETDTVTVCVDDNDESGEPVCEDDPATVTITDVEPTLTVLKVASPLSLPEPGGMFTFTVTVTNTSAEAVTIESLDDDVHGPQTGDADCQVGTLLAANGGSCQFSFQGQFLGNAGDEETDTVTVCVDDNDESGEPVCEDDPATVTITDVEPTLTVLKVASPLSLPEPGGMFTFTVTVTNTSAEAVTIESLDDDVHGPQTGDADCQVGTLLAANGGSCQFSFQGQFLGNAGDEETDTVTVCVDDNDESGEPVCEDDPATVTITSNPGTLIVRKIVINDNGGTRTADTFSFQVNSGQVQPFPNDGGDPLTSQTSLTVPGGQTHTVTEPAVVGYATSYENCTEVKIAFGQTAICTITNNDIPRGVINVIKTANPTSLKEPGGSVNFTVEVQNTGPVNVTINSVVDDRFGNLANVAGGSPSGCFAVPFQLAPGASSTCTFPKNVVGHGRDVPCERGDGIGCRRQPEPGVRLGRRDRHVHGAADRPRHRQGCDDADSAERDRHLHDDGHEQGPRHRDERPARGSGACGDQVHLGRPGLPDVHRRAGASDLQPRHARGRSVADDHADRAGDRRRSAHEHGHGDGQRRPRDQPGRQRRQRSDGRSGAGRAAEAGGQAAAVPDADGHAADGHG